MAKKLFQQARDFTQQAQNLPEVTYEDIEKAKNAISSAFANATEAQQEFLREYQDELEQIEQQIDSPEELQ